MGRGKCAPALCRSRAARSRVNVSSGAIFIRKQSGKVPVTPFSYTTFTLSRWYRAEGTSLRQVLPSPRIKYHLEVLVIHQLLVEDSGVYVCIMNNTLGSQKIEVDLTVQSPLETRVAPASQTVDLNKAAVFRCNVLGHPVKEISWYRNGRQLQMGHR